MICVIDNYDSFVYNIVQYLGEMGEHVKVFRNDKITIQQIEEMQPKAIILSPGPCTPAEAGICGSGSEGDLQDLRERAERFYL